MNKTNAVRIIETAKVDYSTHIYNVDENDLSGIKVAKKINAEPESVFKTLVAHGDKTGIIVFCIPVTEELNLKKAAKESGNKKVELIKAKELLPLTGYVRGGCSPIGMKKKYPVFLDETVNLFDKIYVSAGIRGMQVCLAPKDLTELTEANLCDVI